MARLFFVMGKSSTGKDSIYNRLLEICDLKRVVGYTTRPIRSGETDGIDYHFCDEKTKKKLVDDGKVIEIRQYPTMHGGWEYFTVDDGQIDFSGKDMIMIGTLESYARLKEYYKNNEIVPIYIEVEDGLRLKRAVDRERAQEEPKYEELCRRFLADNEDFSEENLKKAGISKSFNNNDVDSTVQSIAEYMRM